MIFRPDMVAAILAGTKNVTRRISNDGICVCRYQFGRTYAVQPGRGQAAVARIRITSEPRLEKVSEITEDEARREGFASIAEFRGRWLELHGGEWEDRVGPWLLGPLVWRIEFELA